MPTVLIADADCDTRLILATALRHAQHEVIEASNAEDAFSSLSSTHVDAVVLNYPMPLNSGVTLTHAIRAHARMGRVPIINLTSHVVPDVEAAASADGVTFTLAKPAHVLGVLALLESVLRIRSFTKSDDRP